MNERTNDWRLLQLRARDKANRLKTRSTIHSAHTNERHTAPHSSPLCCRRGVVVRLLLLRLARRPWAAFQLFFVFRCSLPPQPLLCDRPISCSRSVGRLQRELEGRRWQPGEGRAGIDGDSRGDADSASQPAERPQSARICVRFAAATRVESPQSRHISRAIRTDVDQLVRCLLPSCRWSGRIAGCSTGASQSNSAATATIAQRRRRQCATRAQLSLAHADALLITHATSCLASVACRFQSLQPLTLLAPEFALCSRLVQARHELVPIIPGQQCG
jgi:hypothetical protein